MHVKPSPPLLLSLVLSASRSVIPSPLFSSNLMCFIDTTTCGFDFCIDRSVYVKLFFASFRRMPWKNLIFELALVRNYFVHVRCVLGEVLVAVIRLLACDALQKYLQQQVRTNRESRSCTTRPKQFNIHAGTNLILLKDYIVSTLSCSFKVQRRAICMLMQSEDRIRGAAHHNF